MSEQFWNIIVWTDDKKSTCTRIKNTQDITSSVKRDEASSVAAWACTAAKGSGAFVFRDNTTAVKGSRLNPVVFKVICSAHIQPSAFTLTGESFTVKTVWISLDSWQSLIESIKAVNLFIIILI